MIDLESGGFKKGAARSGRPLWLMKQGSRSEADEAFSIFQGKKSLKSTADAAGEGVGTPRASQTERVTDGCR